MSLFVRNPIVATAIVVLGQIGMESQAVNPDYKAYWGDYDDDGYLDVLLMPLSRVVALDLSGIETTLEFPLVIPANREARVIKSGCSLIPFGQHGQLGCFQSVRGISQQEIDSTHWQEGYKILWSSVANDDDAFLFVWSRVPGLPSFKVDTAALSRQPGLSRLTLALYVERGIPDLGAAAIEVELDDRTGDGLDDLIVLSNGIPADIYASCPDCSGQASLTFLLPPDRADHEDRAVEAAKVAIDSFWNSYCETLAAGSLNHALAHYTDAGQVVYASILAELGAEAFASLPETWSDPVLIDLQDRTATIAFEQNENGVLRTYSVTLVRGANGWRIDQM